MSDADTCVILVHFRNVLDTTACVRSLLASEEKVAIAVVDTTPHDPDLSTALSFAPETVILRAETNLGFGGGNNLGMEWAFAQNAFEYIFLLNNDACVQPGTITELKKKLVVDSGLSMVAPRIVFMNAPERLWYGGGFMDWRRSGPYTPGYSKSAISPTAMQSRDVTFASGCAMFFRASDLYRLGGFHPDFFMYEEDTELCLRAGQQGLRIGYEPSAIVLHRVQGSSRETEGEPDFWSTTSPRLPFYVYHGIRNRVLNIALHAKGIHLVTALVWLPIYLGRRSLPFLKAGRFDALRSVARGVWDAIHVVRQGLAPGRPFSLPQGSNSKEQR